ncbi:hypothetical protein GCM10025782_07740 [Pedococcus ginsenosidimutans]|uniref:Uncharacterized protein n=1 Tax=Pedococcus ginsenosidimutans TaxID=490570 RepID=A0ABP8XRY6_9MICO
MRPYSTAVAPRSATRAWYFAHSLLMGEHSDLTLTGTGLPGGPSVAAAGRDLIVRLRGLVLMRRVETVVHRWLSTGLCTAGDRITGV